MQTYRDVFAVGEFRTLFAGATAGVAGSTVTMLALSTLVYAHTGSPFLAAVAYLAGFLPQALGALVLGGLADRLPPRLLLAGWEAVHACALAVLALGVLPVWGMPALLMAAGLADSVAAAARNALVADLLPGNGYVLGRSVLNIAVGAMQIAGFGGGALLLSLVGPTAAMWAGAGTAAVVAVLYRLGLRARAPRATERRSLAGARLLLGDRDLRGLLLVQWAPNGLIVGAEALYVPYAGDSAGVLFVAAAGGMLVGDAVVGRWTTPESRLRLGVPLYVLLAAPYLLFLLRPEVWMAAALVAVASFGFAGHLGTQERYLAALPERMRGQGLGLAGSGMLSAQALAASLTGALAEGVPVPVAMALAGLASLTATACLIRHLRPVTRPADRRV
ncbi:MFS transporter [Nonomuraea glycinis]|uniref:Membrane protein n=1 Tax=Nonomuraea glycinis TaxID=2047744 RepID=A0A918A324_9ACTN|nr:MFS transporter [Nonomuraea glycinis]MCA2175889.1 MFS transporter [Nonomuraea glycinis]GGP05589.1 membrane protein [Nonomuraea glycinis]